MQSVFKVKILADFFAQKHKKYLIKTLTTKYILNLGE